jgi:hypothetical protein
MTRHRLANSSSPLAFVFAAALALAPFALGACGDDDEAGTDGTGGGGETTGGVDTTGGGGDTGGSLTGCDWPYSVVNAAGKQFGEGCTSNAECIYNACVMPGDPGNITNSQVGFCSRGCDCNNDTNAQIPADQKDNFDCLYPSGFVNRHHIVVECTNLGVCQGLDSRWTECKLPNTGGARRVCHAL